MTKGRRDHKRIARPVKVLDIESGKLKRYASITKAALATGVDKRRVYKIMTEGGQINGLQFFSDDPSFVVRGKAVRVSGNIRPDEFARANALVVWQSSSINKFVTRAVRKEIEYVEAQRQAQQQALAKLEK